MTRAIWNGRCVALAGAALLGMLGGCGHDAEPAAQKPAATPTEMPTVTVSQAELATWGQRVRVHGTLLPDETATLGSKVPGRISAVLVDVGDIVRKDQPVARLDEVQLELEVRHTQALLAQACAAIGLQVDESTTQVIPENSPLVKQEQAVLEQTKIALDRAQSLRRQNVTTQEDLDQR